MKGVFSRMTKSIRPRILDSDGHSPSYYYKLVGFLALLCSTLIFISFILTTDGYFIYYGDFNAQQIPFHRHAVEMVRSGNLNWDWYTDLGANFIGDYSFYMSTSPFFWLMCLFPSSLTPYLIAPVLCLKFTVAALCAYAYLKRFVKKPYLAVAGALMYAFCGAQIYNIFFNHFHDSVAFFPLMLLGIEEFIQNDRRGLFAFSVFVSASINYFFFAGQAVFCVLYFLFRASSASFKVTVKKFFWLVFEAVVGVLMSMFLFLVAVLSITGNYRLDREFSTLRGAFVWDRNSSENYLYTKRYGHILQSLFYPPDIPSRPEFFGGTDIDSTQFTHTSRWASNAVWVPLFGMTGAITYIWNRRKSWLSKFIIFLVVCSLVPVLNSLFVVGNTSYYARWMYMLAMMLVLATIVCLDRNDIKWTGGISLTAIFAFLILIPSFVSWKEVQDGVWSTTRSSYPLRIFISAFLTFSGIFVCYLLVKRLRGRKIFPKVVLASLAFYIVVYGFIHVYTGKQHCQDKSVQNIIDYYLETDISMKESGADEEEIPVSDSDTGTETTPAENAPIDNIYDCFYRVDGYNRLDSSGNTYKNSLDNLGLYFNLPSIQCFDSTVPSSILNFYEEIVGMTRNVASRPNSSLYGLRSFLSVKYVFVENYGGKNSGYKSSPIKGFTETPVSKQGEFVNTSGSVDYKFYIYENENYLPMGYTYTEFMRESEFKKITKSNRHIYLCSYLVVPDEKADEYLKYLPEVKASDIPKADYSTFEASVNDRLNGDICEQFSWDSNGFTAVIDVSKENYVFFSVPYDVKELFGINFGGWSAEVNGKKVEIEEVFGGLMAVKVPAGDNITISFSYETPGRTIGLILSIVGFIVLGIYLFVLIKVKKHRASYKFFSESYYDDLGYEYGKKDSSFIADCKAFYTRLKTAVFAKASGDEGDNTDDS